jgi:hypothetical protein
MSFGVGPSGSWEVVLMPLLSKWAFWRGSQWAQDRAAVEVARRSCRVVTERLLGSMLPEGMTLAELRGYIRARGVEAVDETAGELLSCRGLSETLRQDLTTRAMDLLIIQLMRDVSDERFGTPRRRVA